MNRIKDVLTKLTGCMMIGAIHGAVGLTASVEAALVVGGISSTIAFGLAMAQPPEE